MDDEYAASDFDEPFIGGVDSVTDDINDQYVVSSPSSFTPLQHSTVPQKRRGRPPKSESEKSEKKPKHTPMRPSGAIRISLTPKVKGPRGRPPSQKNSQSAYAADNNSSSVPVLKSGDSSTKGSGKPRGRPRVHPPKENSEKKPRGRPRTHPIIEGEKALQAECVRLRRVVNKQNTLIGRLKQKLSELGAPLDEANSDSEQNGTAVSAEPSELDLSFNVVETEVPSQVEDTHQKYVEMFAKDSCHSDEDDDNDDVESESG